MAILNYTVSDIAQIVGGKLTGPKDRKIQNILTDSRQYKDSAFSLFLAIKGTHHDGHLFIEDLYKKNLRSFIVESIPEGNSFPDASFIQTDNTLHAFQTWAAHHRMKFGYPLIAITGSNGKTIVKEWLFHILSRDRHIVRSPKSFNSQLGVPLSVMQMTEKNDIAIFEAGISMPEEMERLQDILKPSICLFTNLGSAHDQGFSNRDEKLSQKLILSRGAEMFLAYAENEKLAQKIVEYNQAKSLLLWSFEKIDSLSESIHILHSDDLIEFMWKDQLHSYTLPFKDEASVENVIHVILTALYLDCESDQIQKAIAELEPVAMRLEMMAGLENSTLVNDSYNADLEGVYSAIDFLIAQTEKEKYTLIVSDLIQMSENSQVYKSIQQYAEQKNIHRIITVGHQWKQARLESKKTELVHFDDTRSLLDKLDTFDFREEAILIKGARKFQLEQVTAVLERQQHKTRLELNLNAFTHNLGYYKKLLKPETKVMVMVKAFSYGSGTYEIPKLLEYQNVDYLAVAYTDEGIALRKSGIRTPIMVMNPQEYEFERLSAYNLEPEIYAQAILEHWILFAKENKPAPSIHIKVNTGMNRLGFSVEDIDALCESLLEHKIKIASIFSHLAASDDDSKSDFTLNQIKDFRSAAEKMENRLGHPILKHILNSAGIEKHLDHQMDMVRLGIGLYGIGSDELESISSFKTFISQIRLVPQGEIIGYGANNPLDNEKRIAIINVGYSDGLDRRLSDGVGDVLINNRRHPIIGKVCMDMTMVDITGAEDVHVGNEVILFNEDLTISEMAEKLETIPYEVLTGISQRIPRIYFKE